MVIKAVGSALHPASGKLGHLSGRVSLLSRPVLFPPTAAFCRLGGRPCLAWSCQARPLGYLRSFMFFSPGLCPAPTPACCPPACEGSSDSPGRRYDGLISYGGMPNAHLRVAISQNCARDLALWESLKALQFGGFGGSDISSMATVCSEVLDRQGDITRKDACYESLIT